MDKEISKRIINSLNKNLKNYEEQYQSLVDALPDILYSLSIDRGGVYFSPSVTKILGYPPEYLLNHPLLWTESIHQDDQELVNSAIQNFILGKHFEIEYRMRHANGQWIWLRDRSVRIQLLEGESIIQGIATDISELRDATARLGIGSHSGICKQAHTIGLLQGIEKGYFQLFENMLNGFAYCKIIYESDTPTDFIYLQVNQAFETLTGLKDVTGKLVREVIPGIQITDDELFQKYSRVAQIGKSERFEYYLKALNEWFDISVYSPEQGYFIAIFDVITERKLAEKTLQENEQRLEFYVNNSSMATVEWDSSFIVTRWAGEAERIFGWSDAETLGKPIMDLHMIYEEDIPLVENTMSKLTDGTARYVVSSNRNYTKDGRVIYCEWYNTILRDAEGEMLFVLSQVMDVTGRKQMETKLEQLNNELELRVRERTKELTITLDRLEKERTDRAESEENYRAIFNHAAVGIARLEAPGRYIEVNDRLCEMLGYTREELLSKTFQEITHPDDLPRDTELVKKAIDRTGSPSFSVEKRYLRKSGEYRWVQMTLTVTHHPDGSPNIGIAVMADIQRLMHTEAALERISDEQAIILDNAGVGISYVKNRQQQWANRTFAHIFGYTPDEMQGSSTSRYFLSQEEYHQFTEEAYPMLASGETFSKSLQMHRRDGTLFHARFTGKAVNPGNLFDGVIWILVDETFEQELKRKLLESKSFVDSLIDQSPINMWVSDEKGTLIRANQALRAQFNITDEEIVGKYNIFSDPIVNEQGFIPTVREVFDKGTTARFTINYDSSRTNLSLKNTAQAVLEVTISPVIDSDGNVTNAIIQHLDISEIKQLEDDLRESTHKAESANRAKSEFLSNMSHEIRTPLNSIFGMSQLLQYTELDEEQQECLNAIKISSDNLLSLINDILDLSKIESGKVELEAREFSLRTSINDIIKTQISQIHHKGLNLKTDIPISVPDALIGDQLRLKQILLNLIGNAIKFTERGTITVSVALNEQHAGSVLLNISVTDTGIGINQESIEKIFKPFCQADTSTTRKYGGTGLGLTICSRLTGLLGGRIWVESVVGSGTTFHILAPFALNGSGENRAISKYKSNETSTWDRPPVRILIVEDEDSSLFFITKMLGKFGHSLLVARNGEEAVALWQQEECDVILMDLQMPGMDGIEATRVIRAEEVKTCGHIPIIATTAYALHDERERIIKLGFDGYVSKPIVIEELIAEMQRVLGEVI